MSRFIHKEHNVSVLMYHIVCPAKYRRAVFSAEVDAKLKEVCAEIEKRYEIAFLEIGTDIDHVHFLVQSVPLYSPKKIVQIIKSLTAREIFRTCPDVDPVAIASLIISAIGVFHQLVSKKISSPRPTPALKKT